jgi:hypothetical protein
MFLVAQEISCEICDPMSHGNQHHITLKTGENEVTRSALSRNSASGTIISQHPSDALFKSFDSKCTISCVGEVFVDPGHLGLSDAAPGVHPRRYGGSPFDRFSQQGQLKTTDSCSV